MSWGSSPSPVDSLAHRYFQVVFVMIEAQLSWIAILGELLLVELLHLYGTDTASVLLIVV